VRAQVPVEQRKQFKTRLASKGFIYNRISHCIKCHVGSIFIFWCVFI